MTQFFDENQKVINEELKWNGGKVSVEKAGKNVTAKFNKLTNIEDSGWVPFREKDKSKYSEEEIKNLNAKYWQAISDEETSILSDDELKKKIINMSFKKVFDKSNSFIMFNDDGKFQRFRNVEDANKYYSNNTTAIIKSNTKRQHED